jgi:predicted RNA binding protein YcfA (HicA-like mRNA interferase family)
MPELPILSSKDVIRVLNNLGFEPKEAKEVILLL